MSILPQSRYNEATVARLPNSSGTYNITLLRTVPSAKASFSLYVWQPADRPDTVAQRFLGNPHLWWAIFDINPELIYPLKIPAGTAVKIPVNPVQGQGTLIQ